MQVHRSQGRPNHRLIADDLAFIRSFTAKLKQESSDRSSLDERDERRQCRDRTLTAEVSLKRGCTTSETALPFAPQFVCFACPYALLNRLATNLQPLLRLFLGFTRSKISSLCTTTSFWAFIPIRPWVPSFCDLLRLHAASRWDSLVPIRDEPETSDEPFDVPRPIMTMVQALVAECRIFALRR